MKLFAVLTGLICERSEKVNMTEVIERELTQQYEKYYRFAFSVVRNREDALDVVQEAAYRAIRSASQLRQQEHADTWIHRIILNTAMDLLHRKNRECLQEDEKLQSVVEPSVENGYEKTELYEMLGMLEPEDRTILVLKYFEDRKLEEIAQITGKNVNTVKTRLYRSLEKLKAACEGSRKKGGI